MRETKNRNEYWRLKNARFLNRETNLKSQNKQNVYIIKGKIEMKYVIQLLYQNKNRNRNRNGIYLYSTIRKR